MTRKYYIVAQYAFLFLLGFTGVVKAQNAEEKATKIILQKDSLFWQSYNRCDTSNYSQFFSDDVEFYHDKGGITLGVESMAMTMKKNLCSNSDFRIKREAVKGTEKIYMLRNSGEIYGAIFSGEHLFYVLEKGKEARLDGKANFTHLWLLKDGAWKMSRILSYDHGPAPYINKRKEIKISEDFLNQFVGEYKGAQTGKLIIQKENNLLTFADNNKKSILYPEGQNLFFMKERDITFEFMKNGKDKVDKLLVRENGEIVEELIFQK